MRIISNSNLLNDSEGLTRDPAIETSQKIWGKKGIYEKSAIPLRIFNTAFGSISLLYGPRQIGKTSSLKLWLSQLQDSETISFLDCSTIINKKDLAEQLSKDIEGKTSIVLDEVQSVEGWHLALRSLYQEGKLRNVRLWCTGSEARHILESGERLPGRKGEGKVIFARPWSFREYIDIFYPELALNFNKLCFKDITQNWLNTCKHELTNSWQDYLLHGGFPKVLAEKMFKQTISDETFRVYEDWVLGAWSTIRTQEQSLRAVCKRLIETINSRVSFEALKKNTDILSANTVRSLLEIQEDHFSIRVVGRFDPQKDKFLPVKLKKIYAIDPYISRILQAIGNNIRRNYLEQIDLNLNLQESAFSTQFLRHEEVNRPSYLYSDATKAEIDFYFEGTAFELKSNNSPTKGQLQLLTSCKHSLIVNKQNLPLVAYLVGEKRG